MSHGRDMPEVEIREATATDAGSASALVLASFHACVAPHYTAEGVATFAAFAAAARLAERLSGESRGWLATNGGTPVGFIEMTDRHVRMFFVAPERQRAGIGRRLLHAVLGTLGEGPLTVHASPNALEGYLRLGFRPEGHARQVNGMTVTQMRRT